MWKLGRSLWLLLVIALWSRSSAASEPIKVSEAPGDSIDPSVAVLDSSSATYVVWENSGPGAPGLYFRRYHADGSAASGEIRFHPRGAKAALAVGSDRKARVAWLEGGTVYFAILDEDGSLFSGPTAVEGNAYRPRIALGAGNEANLVYEHRRITLYYVVFRRFDAQGNGPLCRTVLDNGDIIGDCRKEPDVLSDAFGSSAVFWFDRFGFSGHKSTLTLVESPACRRDDRQFVICDVMDTCASDPTVVFWPADPSNLYTFWEERLQGRRRVFSACGTPLDDSTGEARSPRAVGASDQSAIVVWEDDRDGNWEIYTARQLPDGSKPGGVDARVTDDPGRSLNPAVALSGDEPVIVWQDDRGGDFAIYLKLPAEAAPPVEFRRGDANDDGEIDVADAVVVLLYLFNAPRLAVPISCMRTGDADGNGTLNITDPVFLLSYLFRGGLPLPAPFPACGSPPVEDGLGCESFGSCD